MIDCTGNFDLLLTRRPICTILNPLALDEGQRERLNTHMMGVEGPDSPIFLVTQDAEGLLYFPTLRVSMTARRDRTRSRIMKQLRETDIDPFFAFDYDTVMPAFMLNDGFVVLDITANTYDRSAREVIRISAIWVADFECLDHFETLVHTDLPVSPEVTEDTGITGGMLSTAPSLPEALKILGNWHGCDVLVAYNWEWFYPLPTQVEKQHGYQFDAGRMKLDLRTLLLRLFPTYFARNPVDIDSALRITSRQADLNRPYCEKLARLLIYALCYMRENCGFHAVTDIFRLYQDNNLARSEIEFQKGGRRPWEKEQSAVR